MASRNARIGLVLFFVYLLLYGGFMALNAFSPETMEREAVAGINLAIIYGFALIAAALVLALLYGVLCMGGTDRLETRPAATTDSQGSDA